VFSPDGSKVAAGVDNVVAIWDVATGERLLADRPGHENGIGATSCSADGRLVATAGYDGTVHVWEADSGRHAWGVALAADSNIREAAFSRDGQALVACGLKDWTNGPTRGIAKVWTPAGALVGEIDFPPDGRGLAVAPDGGRIVVAHSHGGIGDTRLELWQVNPPQKLGEFPRDPKIGLSQHTTMIFSPDGRYVHIAEFDGNVRQWDTTAAAEDRSFMADWRPREQRTKQNRLWVPHAVFNPDASLLVASTNDTLSLWDVAAGTLQGTITVPEAPHGFIIGLSADGLTLAASEVIYGGDPGSDEIRIFDLETRQVVLTLSPGDARAMSLAFSADGRLLVTGMDNGTAIVWDVSR
jgi:WD40 repeat protein